jgi:hypothetical protein
MVDVWKKYWNPEGKWEDFNLPHWSEVSIECPRYNVCPCCGGRRVSYGATYPPYELLDSRWVGDTDYCVDTNTIADPTCELCRGRTYRGPSLLEVCGHVFSYHNLPKIAALPGVRVCRAPDVILFQADGFEGMAMGVQND